MTPRVAVIDYGIGNLRSAEKALQRVGADAELTNDAAIIAAADAVVLPGVGNFGRCMQALHDTGLAEPATAAATSGRPFLGICVGMQMLFESSQESPGVDGLGILGGHVELLPDSVKRPQMQWNPLRVTSDDARVQQLDGQWMYFVHSYAVRTASSTLATCDYGGDMVAVAGAGSVIATQFHPEKSGASGLAFLRTFVEQVRPAVAS